MSNKTILSIAIVSALGTATIAPQASAVILADGVYNVYVNTTPVVTGSTGTFYNFGKDGAWSSSFTFGGPTPSISAYSSNLSDNSLCVTGSDAVCRGSSIGGDGYAGHWVLSVSGGAISFVSFAEDVITSTALGNFAQYGTVTGIGTISPTGDITIAPTGRLTVNEAMPFLYDLRWNVSPAESSWEPLTTGSANNGPNTINGAAVASLGDVDSDGLPDYSAIFVSGGGLGNDFGPGGEGIPYFEAYNVRIELISSVPIPAAVWLFGSGILGLGTLMRRKRRQDLGVNT